MKGSNKKQYSFHKKAALHVGFLLGLLFDPDDGSDMFLPNVG
jgi:hypothetical protein